jgi:pyrroline-5-carboxylate reductase
MAAHAKIILLGCAPTELSALLEQPDLVRGLKNKFVISLLAGVSYEQLAHELKANGGSDDHAHLVRVLPTLGASIGDSVTLCATQGRNAAEAEHVKTAAKLFEQVGTVQYVPESLMVEATAIGALCNALTIVAIDTIADASAADGLPRPTALSLVQRSLASMSGLMLSGMTPERVKNAMAIPTGITINSVLRLEREARPAIADATRVYKGHVWIALNTLIDVE